MSDLPFKTCLILSSYCSGSTMLNVCLSHHPDIFGWDYEILVSTEFLVTLSWIVRNRV
jgi:hypothetical protein